MTSLHNYGKAYTRIAQPHTHTHSRAYQFFNQLPDDVYSVCDMTIHMTNSCPLFSPYSTPYSYYSLINFSILFFVCALTLSVDSFSIPCASALPLFLSLARHPSHAFLLVHRMQNVHKPIKIYSHSIVVVWCFVATPCAVLSSLILCGWNFFIYMQVQKFK